jgi:hypothetical protein
VRNQPRAIPESETRRPAQDLGMLYKLGRLLQLAGLILLPVAVAGNVARPDEVNLKMSLALSAVGVAVFVLGWWLQQATRPR